MNELTDYSLDTENGEKNYNLAAWYERQNHTAPAHSYYLRASERSEDKILIYKSLLRSAFCYQKQGSREGTEKVLIENALISSPDRPEAYYFLSSIYQTRGDWQNCYIYANLGLQCYERNNIEDIDIPEYSGKHLLMFQKMVASWPWGKGKETRELCQLLRSNYYHLMDENQKKVIDENVEKFGLGSTIKSKQIIDCFRFFNEKELLELRFNMLKDYVDIFVILEGTKTQSGIPREELLAKKYIKELGLPEDKFIVLEVELPSNDENIENTADDIAFRSLSGKSNDSYKNSVNARTRERLLLNSLLTIIDQFDDNTVFFVSDCDEIIKPENIPYFSDMALANQNCLIKIPLIELEGKANLRAYNVETDTPVCVDNVFFMCTTSHFKNATPFQMRFNINNPYPIVYITQDGKRIEECGWHFSWMGDNNRLKLKQKSTSHYADRINDAIHKDMNSKELEEFINQWEPSIGGINPWGYTKYVLKEYPIENLPIQILENDHLKNFFLLENKNTNKIYTSLKNYSIPVIGVPIVNGVHWLKRLIDSVDYPVKDFFIINNNGRDQITDELNNLCNINHNYIENIKVCHLPSNIGVAGAWNLIIKLYVNSPFWIIVNNDISFTPGMLEKFYDEAIQSDSGMIHAKKSDWGGGSYDLFLIKDCVIQECGLFDENLYPAYAEDIDYYYRIMQKNIKISILNIDYLHGDKDYSTSGSQTWRLDMNLKEKLDKSRILNETEYLTKKWGDEYMSANVYSNPFNNNNYDLNYTFYDLNFVRQKHLGF